MATIQERTRLVLNAQADTELQATLLKLCERSPVFWFNNFCWTFDPRMEGDDPTILPFNLYPFQQWCINDWLDCLMQQRDFGIEKCRDMGVSWMIILLFQWCWLFKPGWNFHMGSRKEDYVDKIGDPSTLFEKFRFNLYMLPHWMMPEGFSERRDDNYMRISNPANKNVMTGESANANFARAGRYRAVFFDEMAFWNFAELAWASASHSTKCRIANSTPFGKANKFGALMNDPKNERLMSPPYERQAV